jgi:Sec-independent protein translocase protein TatA
MLDMAAWGEFLIILILALIIIGPKDMPRILRAAGRWIGKIRDFSYAVHNTLTTLSHATDEPPVPPTPQPLKRKKKKVDPRS